MARRGDTIELAVLGLLHEGPMHGYELRKRLNLMLGWGRVLSYGSLYPALKKMLRRGLIAEFAGAGSTPPSSRRQRIVYQVTEKGTDEFERLMSEVGPTAWEDDNFDIRFRFFSSTDMEIRLRVLEGRRSRLQERLDRVQRELAMTQKEVDRYAAELQRHGVESVEREVRWLSDLIKAERGGAVGADPDEPVPDRSDQGVSGVGPVQHSSGTVAVSHRARQPHRARDPRARPVGTGRRAGRPSRKDPSWVRFE